MTIPDVLTLGYNQFTGSTAPTNVNGGDPGVSPDPNQVLKMFVEWEAAQGSGIPIKRFRGLWKYQEASSLGDLVAFQNGLYLAHADDEGVIIPNDPLQQNWVCMIDMPVAGGGGNSGGKRLTTHVTECRTITDADDGHELVCDSTEVITLIFSEKDLPIDFEVVVTRLGAGEVWLVPGEVDTLNGDSDTVTILEQYLDVRVKRYS